MRKVFKLTKILFFLFHIVFALQAQKAESQKHISKIEFTGIKKTKGDYLKSLLQCKINEPFTLQLLETDIQTLKNLSSVANAKYKLDTINQNIQLVFTIDERKTILPIINFGGIKGNIWFTLGVIDNNFRGYGDLALAFYQNNNGRHAGQVYFKNPGILNSPWGYSFIINKWASFEPVFFEEGTVDYLYDNNSAGASLLHNFGLHHQVELGGTFFREKYQKAAEQTIDNPPGPANFNINKFLTRLEYKQNFLNYDYFYIKGFETLLNYQNVYNIPEKSWFNSLQFRGKLFLRPVDKLNMAIRLVLAISTNNNSPFAPFVADSHVNIRGIGNKIDRGTAQAVINVEGRYTVFRNKYWSSQLVVFSDLGSWRNPGGQLINIFDSDQFRHFIGGGVRFNYQKIFGATLRVDYGIDIYNPNQRGFVLGFGQYF